MDLDHDLNTFKNGVDPGEHILNADLKQCNYYVYHNIMHMQENCALNHR